jgi:hypothetical protein
MTGGAVDINCYIDSPPRGAPEREGLRGSENNDDFWKANKSKVESTAGEYNSNQRRPDDTKSSATEAELIALIFIGEIKGGHPTLQPKPASDPERPTVNQSINHSLMKKNRLSKQMCQQRKPEYTC